MVLAIHTRVCVVEMHDADTRDRVTSAGNDLTYGTLPTGVDPPSLFRVSGVHAWPRYTPISVTLACRT